MNTTMTYMISAIGFVLILATGFWTSSLGRPLNIVVNTIHKLVSVGTAIFFIVMLVRVNRVTLFTGGDIAMIVVTALCFVVMLATGGFLSNDNPLPRVVLLLHRIFPVLSILSAGAMLYMLLGK